MHNRVKVRTSEEKAAAEKRKEREHVVAYRAGMSRVLSKKKRGEFDAEAMAISAQILEKCPDIATLWNVRREYLLNELQVHPETDPFGKELEFTVVCLRANPKSYCIWHHRSWCLETCATPDWTNELALCTKFLGLDERNFHVWDYRRYVATKAAVPEQDELDFCTKKIEKNFSNYSSWHYRSKLLPRLHPHASDPNRPISETALKQELSTVLKATFTAPNDSSAWFYQRWLLGYSAPALDLAGFKITPNLAIVTFSTPVQLNDPNCRLSLNSTTNFDTTKWQPVGPSSTHSCIWMLRDSFALNEDDVSIEGAAQLTLDFLDSSGKTHCLKVSKKNGCLFGIKHPKFGYEFEASVRDELQEQLQEFVELSELEDDSKWTLLTTALMMRAIDRARYHSNTLDRLNSLSTIDPARCGYYKDLANKWSIEEALQKWIDGGSFQEPIDLSASNIATLNYDQYLCLADCISLGNYALRPETERKLETIYAECGVLIVKDED